MMVEIQRVKFPFFEIAPSMYASKASEEGEKKRRKKKNKKVDLVKKKAPFFESLIIFFPPRVHSSWISFSN